MKKKRKTSKLAGESLDIKAEQVEKLKSLFPQAVKDGKVDFDALKQTLGEETTANGQRYGLGWAGKSDCFGHIQQATSATLRPIKDESVDFDTTENLFIEGDNLEVLKVLQKSYYGKVKMIYIDPPYNTGNDSFIYPDRFKESKEDYLQRVGEKDTEGNLMKDGFFRKNSKDAGHFHSNWLSMMYPRLFLARNLLKEDGVIFVSIDDNEVHNLKMIMNEVFGEENFVGCLVWKRRASSALADNNVSTDHEYVLCFHKGSFLDGFVGKEKNFSGYKNPNNDPKGPWVLGDLTVGMTASMRPNQAYDLIDPKTGNKFPYNPNRVWGYIPKSMNKLIDEGKVYFPEDISKRPMLKRYKNDLKDDHNPFSSLMLQNVGLNTEATKLMQQLMDGNIFDYSKPQSLANTLVQQVTKDEDMILDFFAGSCTMAHAVMQLNAEDGGNRKYICVQLAEPCDEKSEAYKAGYKTIADIGKERIRRAGKKIKAENAGKLDFDGGKLDLGFKVFKLDESNFKQWRTDIKTAEQLEKQMSLFIDNVRPDATQEDILYELILKTGLDLNVKVEAKKANGKQYFMIDDGRLIICLADKITKPLIEKITKAKKVGKVGKCEGCEKFICLDRAFGNNDQLKTNTALQMEAENIEFKVI